MSVHETKGNQSVGKALKIIEILASSAEPMRLIDIAALVEMPQSTALRMMATLMDYGYIAQSSDSQKYFLTMKFAQIGSMVASRFNIRDVVRPYIVKLSRDCGEASCLAIDSNMEALYVDVVDGPDGMLRIMQHIGKRSPLHCSGVGKCLLLNYSEAEIDDYIEKKGLAYFTPNTITTKEMLLEELEKVRKQGYAMDNEECELGARCISGGIRNYSGKIVAAISISGPVNRMSEDYVKQISVPLMEAVGEISNLL
ncbi:IclR family transcriptional regulator [Tyzzerella sp. OttesenSCG-928-J15]|nr:IclR family transcriptional regulator [Tyzzerella sp. OttesenSCG-928-J15]